MDCPDIWSKENICSKDNQLIREVVDKYSRTYKIKYVTTDYIIIPEDFNGFTMILSEAIKPTKIYLPKVVGCLPEGRCITIGQETDHTVTLVATPGVSFHPRDGNTIRREGGVISLIYEGNNKWRLIGELP